MVLKSFHRFAIGLLAGLAVAVVAFMTSAADGWVIDGIGHKSAFRD